MLTYAYNHLGGQNNPLVSGTIPISPTTGYSHINTNGFVDYKANKLFQFTKVRFYCHSSLHTRKIHFYTPNSIVVQMAYDGGSTGNTVSAWTTGFTAYADHSGILPAGTTNTLGTLTNFPFYATIGQVSI